MEDNSRPTGLVAIEGRGKPIDLPKIEASPEKWGDKAKNIIAKWGRIVAPALLGIANIANPTFAASSAPEISLNKAIPAEVQPAEKPADISLRTIDYSDPEILSKLTFGNGYLYDPKTKSLIPLDEKIQIDKANADILKGNILNNIESISKRAGRPPDITYIYTNGMKEEKARNVVISYFVENGQYSILWVAEKINDIIQLSPSASEIWPPIDKNNYGYVKVALPPGYEPNDGRVGWYDGSDNQVFQLQAKNNMGPKAYNPTNLTWVDFSGPLPDVLARPSAALLEKAGSPFINALNNAGMKLTLGEFLTNGLQYKTITGVDGKNYEIAYYHLDPDPKKKGEALEGDIPMMIKTENGWEEISISNSCKIMGLTCGTVSGIGITRDWIPDHEEVKKIMIDGNALKIDYDLMWWLPEKEQQSDSLRTGPTTFNFKNTDDAAAFAKNNQLKLSGQTLLVQNPYFLPSWLKDISNSRNKEQLFTIAKEHIKELVSRYPEATEWTVLAELQNPYFENPWVKTFGLSDVNWITDLYMTTKTINPNAKLVYSDFDIEFGGTKADRLFQIMKKAKEAGAPIDVIAFQMHINAKDLLSNPKKLEALGKQIDRYKEIGISVEIGEMDISMIGISRDPQKRMNLQAKVAKDIIETALVHGVKNIFLFGVNDKHSWKNQEQNGGGPEADATFFNEESNRKLSYFTLLQSITDYSAR